MAATGHPHLLIEAWPVLVDVIIGADLGAGLVPRERGGEAATATPTAATPVPPATPRWMTRLPVMDFSTTQAPAGASSIPTRALRTASVVTTPDRLGFHDLGSQSLGASLIERLHAVQQLHGYLPRAELQQLAVAMERPLSEVMGVASFISCFGLPLCGRVGSGLPRRRPRRLPPISATGSSCSRNRPGCCSRCSVGRGRRLLADRGPTHRGMSRSSPRAPQTS